MYKFVKTGWNENHDKSFKKYYDRKTEFTIEKGVLIWGHRVVIPSSMQKTILNELHKTHMGIVKTKSLARSYVWWPSMDTDIENLINSCKQCAKYRDSPEKSSLISWEWPKNPWQRLHIDFFGPLFGMQFLIAIDAHTKWPEVFALKSITTEKTIEVLSSLFARFGLPDMLVSDNGPQLTSELFKHFLEKNGIKHVKTAPYHPASNGAAENMVKTVKKSLLKIGNANFNNINSKLYRILFDYRNTIHCTTGKTPAELFLGRKIKCRFDLLSPCKNYNQDKLDNINETIDIVEKAQNIQQKKL